MWIINTEKTESLQYSYKKYLNLSELSDISSKNKNMTFT